VLCDAVTTTVGLAGVGVGVGLAEDAGAEGDVDVAPGDAVGVFSGREDPAGVLGAVADLDALGELVTLGELVAFTDLDARGFADGEVEGDGFAVGDGVAVGVAARAELVMPLEMTKMPVAKPSVTGRVCADRMRTPCLCLLSRLDTCSSACCFIVGAPLCS
jgi:hypothetical protein